MDRLPERRGRLKAALDWIGHAFTIRDIWSAMGVYGLLGALSAGVLGPIRQWVLGSPLDLGALVIYCGAGAVMFAVLMSVFFLVRESIRYQRPELHGGVFAAQSQTGPGGQAIILIGVEIFNPGTGLTLSQWKAYARAMGSRLDTPLRFRWPKTIRFTSADGGVEADLGEDKLFSENEVIPKKSTIRKWFVCLCDPLHVPDIMRPGSEFRVSCIDVWERSHTFVGLIDFRGPSIAQAFGSSARPSQDT